MLLSSFSELESILLFPLRFLLLPLHTISLPFPWCILKCIFKNFGSLLISESKTIHVCSRLYLSVTASLSTIFAPTLILNRLSFQLFSQIFIWQKLKSFLLQKFETRSRLKGNVNLSLSINQQGLCETLYYFRWVNILKIKNCWILRRIPGFTVPWTSSALAPTPHSTPLHPS